MNPGSSFWVLGADFNGCFCLLFWGMVLAGRLRVPPGAAPQLVQLVQHAVQAQYHNVLRLDSVLN
eukprot:1159550-Pelagomonas_calceolata.AAC.5